MARQLSSQATILGTSRSENNFDAIRESGARPFLFDGTFNEELLEEMKSVTHFVQSIAPGPKGDQALLHFSKDLRQYLPKLKWLTYLSTIGVYGDHGGAWINEETPLQRQKARSKERIEAEAAWQSLASAAKLPLVILRLAGIYGPGRNALVSVKNGTAQRIVKKDQVFNRIRVEDIARACEFLAAKNVSGVFNLADDEPAPPQDVITEAARLLKAEQPPLVPFEKAALSPMALSFYSENKRASNARIKGLGFQLLYPNYRMSLAQLAADENLG